MRQSLGVHRDVALDARDLLACVIALQARRVRVLHALRVHDQERAAGVAPQFLAGRASLIFNACSSRHHPRVARSRWQSTSARCAIWESRWAVPATDSPCAAGTARRRTPRTAPLCVGRLSARTLQQWPDHLELLALDVAGVAFSHSELLTSRGRDFEHVLRRHVTYIPPNPARAFRRSTSRSKSCGIDLCVRARRAPMRQTT